VIARDAGELGGPGKPGGPAEPGDPGDPGDRYVEVEARHLLLALHEPCRQGEFVP
jgi:hypothetical protein